MLSPVARIFVPLVVVASSVASVAAQDWGAKMVDKHEIMFGSVPRYSDTTFKVKVKNIFVEEIQITSLSTSCGCISWIDKQLPISIPSKEERELTIRLDTVGFQGDRKVRAFMSMREPSKGYTSQVSIPVEGRIRSDFEVRPSHVGFGPIDLGKSYIQRIGITYTGGRPDWKLLQAKVNNPYLTAQIVEKGRSGGTATYEANVTIAANAPAGTLRDQLILTTNDVGDSTITVPVEARIEPDIVVTDVQFGTVSPGQPKTAKVVVRGKKPFKIEKINHITSEVRAKPTEEGGVPAPTTISLGDDAIAAKGGAETPTLVHTLTVTLTPPAEAGMFDEEFAVIIEGRPQPVSFKAKGRIQAQEASGASK